MRAIAERAQAEGYRRQVIRPDGSPLGNIETHTFRFTRPMAVPDLLDWLGTYSWVITASDQVKAAGRGARDRRARRSVSWCCRDRGAYALPLLAGRPFASIVMLALGLRDQAAAEPFRDPIPDASSPGAASR